MAIDSSASGFDVVCLECAWSGDVSDSDLEDDFHDDGEGWDTNCVCPKCGGQLERD